MTVRSWGHGHFGYLIAVGIAVSALAATSKRDSAPAIQPEAQEWIQMHEQVIRAQQASIQCLKSGKQVEDCEAQLEEDCQGTDLDACLGPSTVNAPGHEDDSQPVTRPFAI